MKQEITQEYLFTQEAGIKYFFRIIGLLIKVLAGGVLTTL